MNVAILMGGRGSRLHDLTRTGPKALVEIGGKPILWHLLMYFRHFGCDRFLLALGHKGDAIKQYVADWCAHQGNLTADFGTGTVRYAVPKQLTWTIDAIETGQDTPTGGRLKRLAPYLGNATAIVSWTDGLTDLDLNAFLAFHRAHGKLVTVAAVHPTARFGQLALLGDRVAQFVEKPRREDEWVNGGIFAIEPAALDYVTEDGMAWEREPLESLARDGHLMAYRHGGFWQCMDTPYERDLLDRLWEQGQAPWKVWE